MPHSDDTPRVSFIGIVDFTEKAKWIYCSDSVHDLLGYEPRELIGQRSLDLVHPDELIEVKNMHYTTIMGDKAATLAYLRMKHKNPYKGYILCAISRTVAHNVLVGSISFATPGPRAMHNNSTASEIQIISPTAREFEFRKWNDPDPMGAQVPPTPTAVDESPSSPTPAEAPRSSTLRFLLNPEPDRGPMAAPRSLPRPEPPSAGSARPRAPSVASSSATSSDSSNVAGPPSSSPLLHVVSGAGQQEIPFTQLPVQSVRTALILDRFTTRCTVLYVSNDTLVQTTTALGRPLFDFVAPRDAALVQSWIDVIKSWGVNERGQPSDGGFGFGRFAFCRSGRDSSLTGDGLPPSRKNSATRKRRESTKSELDRERKRDPSAPDTNTRRISAPEGMVPGKTRRSKRANAQPIPATWDEVPVDAIFSAHSDGLMVILRPTSTKPST